MRRKKRRKGLLSRLEQEIRNFLSYWAARQPQETLTKGIAERKVEIFKAPKHRLRPQAVSLIRLIIASNLLKKLKNYLGE